MGPHSFLCQNGMVIWKNYVYRIEVNGQLHEKQSLLFYGRFLKEKVTND